MSVVSDIMAALPLPHEEPLSARKIHQRMGRWAPTSVRTKLGELARDRKIEGFGDDLNRTYRRLPE